jgi:aryl-alcohol dehydrogenase-like predicted oxidoreductase
VTGAPELILGTAQLGDAYGVTNAAGRLDDAGARLLLARATERGISTFDTAAAYGDAEVRLGRFAAPSARFITKTALDGPPDRAHLYGDSLGRLETPRLAAVLLHRTADLGSEHLDAALGLLRAGRDAGELERFGVSVYDIDDLRLAAERITDLGIVQLPGSAVDRRLLDDPLVRELHDRGVQIHVRSVFLQGLLLQTPQGLPPGFEGLGDALAEVGRRHDGEPGGRTAALLRAVRDSPQVDAVVVGATSATELDAICDAWQSPARDDEPLPAVPAGLLDPRTWPR